MKRTLCVFVVAALGCAHESPAESAAADWSALAGHRFRAERDAGAKSSMCSGKLGLHFGE
jgi:hypothetical protein